MSTEPETRHVVLTRFLCQYVKVGSEASTSIAIDKSYENDSSFSETLDQLISSSVAWDDRRLDKQVCFNCHPRRFMHY